MPNQIHPTAIIDPTARIGDNVTVGPFTIIGPECALGDGCVIGSSVAIHKWTELGQGCKVWHGASLGSDTQDLKYKGAKTKLVIGAKTVIREFVTVTLSTLEGQVTKIGNNCLLMAYSHVAHECTVGDNVILANSATLAGHTIIENFAIIGGLTPVHQFSRVGCHSIVGGSSAVQKDVLPYAKAFGNPLKMYGLNTIGLTRRGFSQEKRELLDRAYRIIFRSNLNTTQALTRLKEEMEMTPEVRHMVEFIEGSERGITK
ncbi:acyl-ACP--UDP-N-acetylglucosamine O-acyltransferase [candidate division TA06 bacterium]|uniref:Acyl-[acyl-carrier-protein]--UDP-N-acetylglucosamine O-acyltransferase n=1 Tax=candidate division TA06 bacterium TaxID=2250710 RepID=A0A933ID07_UNCT6|nr:acyl-ACP--UDP-N-acetylglucosamine O-acyltransferase [candidate division TA06 bacterium]